MKNINKFLIGSLLVVFSLVLSTGVANAATTIGTSILTTGTLEVQNTASAAYFLTGNTIQVAGYASAAYSRFGTGTTGHSADIDASNAVLITGALEVDGKAFFDGTASVAGNFEVGGTASISGIVNLNNGQVRPQTDSATAFRFQNAAGTTSVLTIDTTNGRVGIGGTPGTTFEVQGTASASYFLTGNTIQVGGYASVAYNRFGTAATTHALSATNDVLINGKLEVDGKAFFDGTASVAGDFEVIGTASASKAFVTTSFVVGSNVASSSTVYVAEFVSTATTSVLFGGSSTTLGTCLQMKNTAGQPVYARVIGTTFTVSAVECH